MGRCWEIYVGFLLFIVKNWREFYAKDVVMKRVIRFLFAEQDS